MTIFRLKSDLDVGGWGQCRCSRAGLNLGTFFFHARIISVQNCIRNSWRLRLLFVSQRNYTDFYYLRGVNGIKNIDKSIDKFIIIFSEPVT